MRSRGPRPSCLLTIRGTPFMYYGEEIGLRDIVVSDDEIIDPPARRALVDPDFQWWNRDGCHPPRAGDPNLPRPGWRSTRWPRCWTPARGAWARRRPRWARPAARSSWRSLASNRGNVSAARGRRRTARATRHEVTPRTASASTDQVRPVRGRCRAASQRPGSRPPPREARSGSPARCCGCRRRWPRSGRIGPPSGRPVTVP